MTVCVTDRFDLTLDAFRRVAWERDDLCLHPTVLDRLAKARAAFIALIEDESVTVYGVTSGFGDRAGKRLTADERVRHAQFATNHGVSFGAALPERVTRGIVFARLANIAGGHAAIRPEVALAVAGMLDGRDLPRVPAQGNGGSGEIIALGHLFAGLSEKIELADKEGLALVSGSPCAAALVADAALAARRRLRLAYDAFALSIEAFRAPLEAYDEVLQELWGDVDETAALRALGTRLAGASQDRAGYQAPVSFRILPRIMGQAERAVAAAERSATTSLASVTDNPVFIPPAPGHSHGRVLSNGGYHNGSAPQALNGLAAAWADVARLAERHIEQLWVGPGKRQSQAVEGLLNLLLMVTVGYGEEAAAAAQPTIATRSAAGQNDVGAPSFLAWRRAVSAADALDACLAILIGVSTQLLIAEQRHPAPSLVKRFWEISKLFPAVTRPYPDDVSRIADTLRAEIYPSPGAPDLIPRVVPTA